MCLSEATEPCPWGLAILNGRFWRKANVSILLENTIPLSAATTARVRDSNGTHSAMNDVTGSSLQALSHNADKSRYAPTSTDECCLILQAFELSSIDPMEGSSMSEEKSDLCEDGSPKPATRVLDVEESGLEDQSDQEARLEVSLRTKRKPEFDSNAVYLSNKRVYIYREDPNDDPRDRSRGDLIGAFNDTITTLLNTPDPHICSMAQLLDLSLPELELISEFTHHTHPEILRANSLPYIQWLGGGHLIASSTALKQACLFLVSSDLAQRKAKRDSKGRFSQIPFKIQERLLREFTNLLKWFKHDSQELTLSSARDDVLVRTAIYVYLCGLAIGPQLLPFFTSGNQDLAGLCYSIQNTHVSLMGEFRSPIVNFPMLPDKLRTKLPREEDLWAVMDHVMVDENIPSLKERRHIRAVISKEVYAMIELFNMDVMSQCISHLSVWSVFNNENFKSLRREENPYSTIIISYYLAYCHLFHSFSWWRDRAQYDLYDVVEYLSDYYVKFVRWPLEVVESYQWTQKDLLSGRFREEAAKMKSFR